MLITLNDHINDDNISELKWILCKNCKFNFDKKSYNECSFGMCKIRHRGDYGNAPGD